MKKALVSIRDVKVGYLDVRCVDNIDVAKREFSVLFKPNQDTATSIFPSDYELYYLGDYDSSNASFDLQDVPVFLMNGSACVDLWKKESD